MGKQIYLDRVEEFFKKSKVVDFKSIERIVGTKKKANYAKLLISNLLKKGKIKKISKGIYSMHDENSLAVFAFKPAYLGLQSALSYLGIWEQETIPIIVTTKKVRRGVRRAIGANVLIRNIDEKYFFGYSFVKEGELYLPYSDLEKTFIDMVVFNQRLDKEILRAIKKRLDKKKLGNYLKRYNPILRKRVEETLER